MSETGSALPGGRLGGRYGELEEFVWHKIESLQRNYLVGLSSAAASLARLRRAVGTEPGADPFVWEETLGGFPRSLQGHDSEPPSREERAAHAAITLYAVHQQSKSNQGMHKRGINIGRAASLLGLAIHGDEAVLRRFHALGTATSLEETVNHARRLITQFRSESIALDYGRFTVDLARIQNPRLADAVRLDWGRQFYFKPADSKSADAQNGDTPSSSTSNGENK